MNAAAVVVYRARIVHTRSHPISATAHCRVKWKLPSRRALVSGEFDEVHRPLDRSEGIVRRGKSRNEENDKRELRERSAILRDGRADSFPAV